jgi:hypothetical protein
VESPNTSTFLTPRDVQELLRLPTEDAARRFIRRLPVEAGIRAKNMGHKVLVIKERLLAHLGAGG